MHDAVSERKELYFVADKHDLTKVERMLIADWIELGAASERKEMYFVADKHDLTKVKRMLNRTVK
jgi:hypothetical protein